MALFGQKLTCLKWQEQRSPDRTSNFAHARVRCNLGCGADGCQTPINTYSPVSSMSGEALPGLEVVACCDPGQVGSARQALLGSMSPEQPVAKSSAESELS